MLFGLNPSNSSLPTSQSSSPTSTGFVQPTTPSSSPSPSHSPTHETVTSSPISSQQNQPNSSNPTFTTPVPATLHGQPVISNHNDHHMITRAKTGNLKPKAYLSALEPTTVRAAMSDSKWLAAMQLEYKALMENKTWSLVPLPPHKKAIGCKWVFRVKENADGTVNKYKARLVAKGFAQTAGFDFTETFSPVIKPITIRIILTLAVTYK
jgi:histone deacetylase 1/2